MNCVVRAHQQQQRNYIIVKFSSAIARSDKMYTTEQWKTRCLLRLKYDPELPTTWLKYWKWADLKWSGSLNEIAVMRQSILHNLNSSKTHSRLSTQALHTICNQLSVEHTNIRNMISLLHYGNKQIVLTKVTQFRTAHNRVWMEFVILAQERVCTHSFVATITPNGWRN